MRNLTLRVDDNLIKEARKKAIEKGTSLNNLIREFLKELVEGKRKLDEPLNNLLNISKKHRGILEWNREEIYRV